MRSIAWSAAVCVALVSFAGCGDAPTNDDRGYTKAPLEVMGLFIDPEERTDVRAFVRLNLPDGRRIQPPPADSVAG